MQNAYTYAKQYKFFNGILTKYGGNIHFANFLRVIFLLARW